MEMRGKGKRTEKKEKKQEEIKEKEIMKKKKTEKIIKVHVWAPLS